MRLLILFFVIFSSRSQEQIDTLKIVFFENSLLINNPDMIRDNINTFDQTHKSTTEILSDYLLSRFKEKLIDDFKLVQQVVLIPIDSVG
ncbi:MAG: hypothetical protein KDD94_10470, partial [Calditrichaeota bacterium]|nr:hypothetical protein [Calditrichota bacterium]